MYLPRNSFALFLYVMLNVKTFQNRLLVGVVNKRQISFFHWSLLSISNRKLLHKRFLPKSRL